jgi:hypothetical protein
MLKEIKMVKSFFTAVNAKISFIRKTTKKILQEKVAINAILTWF